MPKTKGNKGTKVTLKMAKKALRTTIEGRRKLTLTNMGIVVFPKCILKMGNVDELDLSRNQIEKLPNNIGDLRTLKALDLHSNRLESVPDTMGNLRNLELLNLSNNVIHSLPSTLGYLSQLKILNIGINKLDDLPTSMKELENLEELGLFDNQFKTLPQFVNNLPSLRRLNLRRNPVWFSQGDGTTKPESGNMYLVLENSLCKTCQRKCKQHTEKNFTRAGGSDETPQDEEESKRPKRFTGLLTPNSVAKVNQNAWRIRQIF